MQIHIATEKFSSVSDEQTHKYKKPANGFWQALIEHCFYNIEYKISNIEFGTCTS